MAKRSKEDQVGVAEVNGEVETKADKFKRLANRRVPKAIKALRHVANLATRSTYEFTPEQAEAICAALAGEVEAMVNRFSGSKAVADVWRLE